MNEEKRTDELGVASRSGSMSAPAPPTGPFVLSLVAGVLILLGALMPLVFMGSSDGMRGMMSDFRRGGILDLDSPVLRIIGLGFGGVVLYGAFMLNSRPKQHVTWGALVLIFATLSPFGAMGGFGIGMLAGIVGGAWAISWRPTSAKPSAPAAARFCPQCGRAIAMDTRFCSYCGHQLPA